MICPILVLLDLIFPGFKAAKDFAALRRALPVTPIVAVSMTHDDALIDLVMQAGANGFISKAIHSTHITRALLAIMDGEIVIQRASGGPADSPQDDPMATLTARQIDVTPADRAWPFKQGNRAAARNSSRLQCAPMSRQF